MAVATTMKRPKTIALTYDKTNPMAKKTLDFLLSLELFQIQKMEKSQVEIGLEEYRQGKYTIIKKETKIKTNKLCQKKSGVKMFFRSFRGLR